MGKREITEIEVGRLYTHRKQTFFVTAVEPYRDYGAYSFAAQVLYYDIKEPDMLIGDTLSNAERKWKKIS